MAKDIDEYEIAFVTTIVRTGRNQEAGLHLLKIRIVGPRTFLENLIYEPRRRMFLTSLGNRVVFFLCNLKYRRCIPETPSACSFTEIRTNLIGHGITEFREYRPAGLSEAMRLDFFSH